MRVEIAAYCSTGVSVWNGVLPVSQAMMKTCPMLIRFFLVLAFIAGVRPFIAAAQKEGETMKSKEFFPERKGGWDLQKGVKRYDEEGIFKYMDGAGEVYRLYGFRELTVARCARSGQPEITIELFDMGTSEDAFGRRRLGRSRAGLVREAGPGEVPPPKRPRERERPLFPPPGVS